MKFSRIGSKEDLMIVGIGDTSFKTDDKAVGGVMLFLTNSSMTRLLDFTERQKQSPEFVKAVKMQRH